MQLINIAELKQHPRNQEFFDDIVGDAWDEFLKSVRTSGVIEPIVITQDKIIVSGHQRVRACNDLNIKEIITEMRSYEDEDHILKDLLETNLRQRGIGNPNPVKLGKCIKELERIYGIKEGRPKKLDNNYLVSDRPHTEAEFANTLGISLPTLKNYKKLADLIPEVQDFLDTGMISATTALAINRQLSTEDQIKLLDQLDVTKQYTAKEIQKYIDLNKEGGDASRREKFEKARADRLQEDCEKLSTKISLLESQLSRANSDKEDTGAKQELENLRNKYDALLSQQASYKEQIEKLKNIKLSPAAKSANWAYEFYTVASDIVGKYLSPAAYNNIINEDYGLKNEYFVKACNMLSNAIADVYRNENVIEEVDIY